MEALPVHQGMSTVPELGVVLERDSFVAWGGVGVPSPLAGCKALHAGGDGGVDEVLLRLVLRVGQELDEGQDGVDAG